MTQKKVERLILDNIRLLASGKGNCKRITRHTKLESDLDLNIFDVDRVIMQTFPAQSLVPASSALKIISEKRNIALGELCTILYTNLIPLEEYLSTIIKL